MSDVATTIYMIFSTIWNEGDDDDDDDDDDNNNNNNVSRYDIDLKWYFS
jgi:hypothetical protein